MSSDYVGIDRRLEKLNECIQKLERLRAQPLDTFLADSDLRDIAERNLEIAAFCCSDIARCVVTLDTPIVQHESLESLLHLGTLGILSEETTRPVAAVVQLGHHLVHDYLRIDWDEVFAHLQRVDDLRDFAQAIRRWQDPLLSFDIVFDGGMLMAIDEAALVLVLANDNINAIITKVRTAGASSVEILVPEGVDTLHEPGHCALLRRSAQLDNIRLLVISSDERTLETARKARIETVGVKDAHVALPDQLPAEDTAPGSPYTTTRLPDVPAAQPSQISQSDDEFLKSLDSMDVPEEAPPPPEPQPAAADEEAYDPFADLDDLSDVMQAADERARQASATADESFASDLDDLSAAFDSPGDTAAPGKTTAPAGQPGPARPADAPRPRIRPEDIELSADEKQRANRRRQPSATLSSEQREQREKPKPRRGKAPQDLFEAQREPETKPSMWQTLPIRNILVGVLILLLVIIALYLAWDTLARAVPFLGNSATVTVSLPTIIEEEQQIENQVVALAEPGSGAPATAVEAEEIRATVIYTATGDVTGETMAPVGSARGIVTILNGSAREFFLPQGTEFIGFNAAGNEVYFTSDADVVVPPAVTSDQGAQIVTTRGQAQVTITARTPGSGSNIDGNTITEVIVPGQGPLGVNSGGALLLQHGPITGGDEQVVRVVKDTDVHEPLELALRGMSNRARQILLAQVGDMSGLVLETTTITPTAEYLAQGHGYEQTINPGIGETVDPMNPVFSVQVSGEFSALATPQGEKLEQQLQPALSQQLASEGQLPIGMAPGITDWTWNGETLTIDALLQPTGEELTLSEQTQRAIREALTGKTRAEAEAALNDFVARGIISGYTLPEDVETLPNRIVLNAVPSENQ